MPPRLTRQAPSRVRLPDPPQDYDPGYMRELVSAIEAQLQILAGPASSHFVVTGRVGLTARTLDASGAATLEQTSKFLGELAAELIANNKLGGQVGA